MFQQWKFRDMEILVQVLNLHTQRCVTHYAKNYPRIGYTRKMKSRFTCNNDNITNLLEVFVLNFVACHTHLTGLLGAPNKKQLVDDDVVSVDANLTQLLHKTLCLVQRQKLSDAHTHKCRLFLYTNEQYNWQLELTRIFALICIL